VCSCTCLWLGNIPPCDVNSLTHQLQLQRAGRTATEMLHYCADRTDSMTGSSALTMLPASATAAVAIAVQEAPTTLVSSIVMAATAAGAGVQMAPAADNGQESHAGSTQDVYMYIWRSSRPASSVQGALALAPNAVLAVSRHVV
jgi:hypothetical protein